MITKKNFMDTFRKMNIVPVVFVVLCLFSCKSMQKSVDVDTDVIYFNNVDEYPLFNGLSAEEGFRKYVVENTGYPSNAIFNDITGYVFVEFIVEKDGSVKHTKVVSRFTSLILVSEALRVIKSSPKWTPGKLNGEPVRMRYTIPFDFRLTTVSPTLSKDVELSEETILLKEVVIKSYGIIRKM